MSMESANGNVVSVRRNGSDNLALSASYLNGCPRFSVSGRGTEFGSICSSQYSFDTTRFLKDVMRRREEVPAVRVLPKTQLLAQLLLQEQSERELFVHQERSFRVQITHKREEDRLKKEEQRLQQRNRERLDALKRKQSEELAAKKEVVSTFLKQIDGEVKEKIKLVCMLQPRMNVAATVVADVKGENGTCTLLPELMEEEKRVLKALKAESRYSKPSMSASNISDGCGAVPYWMRTCVAGSFNVAAILRGEPYRATVEDAIKVPNAALRKLIVVRRLDDDNSVVAWAHVRAGNDPLVLATELAQLPPPEELPSKLSVGVVWPKEDIAELNRKSKAITAEPDLVSVLGVSSASLSCGGLSTHEFTKKDIEAIGILASA
ncbi:hypothetical protein LSM04_005614 [Trypanosoma melophagium]|uniref:uncharacterized protein n=1 Tax=Trypanosoma melophagium TaxID=715481 RepID=UPI00351A0487|nr:hypothetical protein LSM04_005614 [Trypanosoma melophagium]